MDVPLNVEVHCSDGACGRSTAIIVDPATNQVTHFVVQDGEAEYLVPISVIADSSATRINLRWSLKELAGAEPFVREVAADEEQLEIMSAAMAGSSALGPYTSPDPAYIADALSNATVMQEHIPENELAIHQEARVEATDGDVGQVDELIIDPETNVISHLVLRQGHFWGKRDITVPVDQIDHVEDDVVYLKLDKKAIGQLPSIHAPKK
jgi:sporulation protein YlmC with PRC-barrel domain